MSNITIFNNIILNVFFFFETRNDYLQYDTNAPNGINAFECFINVNEKNYILDFFSWFNHWPNKRFKIEQLQWLLLYWSQVEP